jgi:hypothetical protein
VVDGGRGSRGNAPKDEDGLGGVGAEMLVSCCHEWSAGCKALRIHASSDGGRDSAAQEGNEQLEDRKVWTITNQ